MAPKDIARSYPKRGLTADVGFRSEPAFVGDGAATFPTASDYAQTAASADLALGDTYTVCAWVRHATSSSSTAMSILSSGSAEMTLSFFAGSNPALYVFNGSANMNTTGVFTIDLHTWYHVAIVIKSSGNSQIFINGIDRTAPHSLSFTASGTPNINLGGYLTGGWQGDLANVALFTSSLTEDQVRQAMRASDYGSHAAIATLEAFYPLSADFNDSTGNHNATASGSPEFRPNRPQLPRGLDLARGAAMARVYTGRCVDFDGSADHLDAAVYSNSSDYYSVSVWIKPDTIVSTRNIVASGDTGDNAFLILIHSTGVIYFYGNDTGGDYAIIHQTTLQAGRWYHLAMSVDQSDAANNTIKAYIDGVENTTSKSAQGWLGNASALEIAARNSVTFFDGAIAGVKVFNSELTAAQVRELYHNPEQVLPTGVSASNLRRYYPLSDYNDTGGTGGRYFQDMGADGEPAEDQGSATMAFAQPVPCPQLGLQQSATRVYFENNATRAEATLGAAPGTACTMSAWVMVEDTTGFQYIFTQGTTFVGSIAWFGIAKWNTNNKLYALQNSGVKAESSLQLSGYGEWNHVVVMTKSTAPYIRWFINGVEDTSITDFGMVAYNLTSTNVSIGGNPAYTNHMQGFANDCAIWDVELSDPEVAALYNSGVQGMDVSTVQSSNLKGWWKCDDLTTFKDYSGNGVNATLTGSFVAASFPENASGSTIVGDFSMKRKGVSVLNLGAASTAADEYAASAKDSAFLPSFANGGAFSCFFRLQKLGEYSSIFINDDYSSGVQHRFAVYLTTANKMYLELGDGASARASTQTTGAISDSDWHHFAMTVDYGGGSTTTIKLFLDGVLDSTSTATTLAGVPNPTVLRFGDWVSAGSNEANGPIACLKFYQVTLSENEIKQIYNSDLRLIKGLENE